MKNAVPFAPCSNGNDRIFVSKQVGCFTYNSIYSVDSRRCARSSV